MEKLNLLRDSFRENFVRKFDYYAIVVTTIVYGIIVMENDFHIFNRYIFPSIVSPFFIPDYIGLAFIASGLLLIIAKIFNNNMFISISLSFSSFIWAIYGITFIFTSPPNSVWQFSILMVGLCIKAGISE